MKIVGKPLEIYDTVCRYLEKQKEDKEIIVYILNKETKEIRSLSQNNTFWKLFTDIGNHLGYTKEETHDILLGGVFGTKEVDIGFVKTNILNKPNTSKLTKEEGTLFIDSILEFCKTNNLPITVTSRELQSLYDTYNL